MTQYFQDQIGEGKTTPTAFNQNKQKKIGKEKNMKSTGVHDGMGVEGWFWVVGVV